jgi:chromosome segregation ATPase
MRRENESLQQQLSRKDSEIQQCQIKSEELTARIADYESCCKSEYTSASQLANSKIVELSKKLREKNSEIQVYKSKYSKLENTVLELKKQSENVQEIGTYKFYITQLFLSHAINSVIFQIKKIIV